MIASVFFVTGKRANPSNEVIIIKTTPPGKFSVRANVIFKTEDRIVTVFFFLILTVFEQEVILKSI